MSKGVFKLLAMTQSDAKMLTHNEFKLVVIYNQHVWCCHSVKGSKNTLPIPEEFSDDSVPPSDQV